MAVRIQRKKLLMDQLKFTMDDVRKAREDQNIIDELCKILKCKPEQILERYRWISSKIEENQKEIDRIKKELGKG